MTSKQRHEAMTLHIPFDEVDSQLREHYEQGWRMLSLMKVGGGYGGYSEYAYIVLEREFESI